MNPAGAKPKTTERPPPPDGGWRGVWWNPSAEFSELRGGGRGTRSCHECLYLPTGPPKWRVVKGPVTGFGDLLAVGVGGCLVSETALLHPGRPVDAKEPQHPLTKVRSEVKVIGG